MLAIKKRPKTKDEVAQELALAHSRIEPSIEGIIRLVSKDELADSEPIKLLEVNRATVPDGIVPISFGPGAGMPYPSVVVEITPAEFEAVRSARLKLPKGWKMDKVLFKAKPKREG